MSLAFYTQLEAVNLDSLGLQLPSFWDMQHLQYFSPLPPEGPFQPSGEFGPAPECGWGSLQPGVGRISGYDSQPLGNPCQRREPGETATEWGKTALLASHPHWTPKAVGIHRRNACPSCLVNTSMYSTYLLYHACYQQKLENQCQDIWARAKIIKFPPHNIGREETEISTWWAGTSIYFLYSNTEIFLGPRIMLCLCTKANPSFYM